jgi:ATP-dependent helicase/nuclease subunit A
LFAISDAALYDFKKAGGSFDFRRDVKEEGLSAEDAELFRDAFARLRRYAKLLAKLPPAAAAEIAASELGLVAEACAGPAGNIDAGSMSKAIELMRAARADNWSASDLIERLGAIISREQTYDGAPAKWHESSVVRVMNLHKAKGLEAPVVFLAGPSGAARHEPILRIDRSSGGAEGYIIARGQRRGRAAGLTLAAPPEWAQRHANEESKFQEAEKDRLMYVAATRAGAMLCVSCRSSHDNYNPWSFFKESLKDAVELEDPGARVAPRVKEITLPGDAPAVAAAAAARRVAACALPTYRVEAAKTFSAPDAPTAGEDAAFYPPIEHAMEWGSVIHLLLEAAMKNPGADLRALAVSELEHHEMSAALADDALTVVSAAMKSDVWARAMRAPRRLIEAPFVAQMTDVASGGGACETCMIRGVVDLVFKEADGWVIVDYKTDDRPGRDLTALERKHMPQLKVYAQAWSEIAGIIVREIGVYFVNTGTYRSERL